MQAGVAHVSIESSDDYENIGLYPEVSSLVARLRLHDFALCIVTTRPPVRGLS